MIFVAPNILFGNIFVKYFFAIAKKFILRYY